MPLTQKNVTIPEEAWAKLRSDAQSTGVPLCIYLTYLIEKSRPVGLDDAASLGDLQRLEVQRERISAGAV
jgi:hypothetical protein